MARIKKLKTLLGQIILPETVTEAVYDGTYGRVSDIIQSINNPNLLINGWFNVYQRSSTGTFDYTASNNGQYLFDRWKFFGDNESLIKAEDTGMSYAITTDSTVKSVNYMEQILDESLWKLLCGKYVTISARVKTTGHSTFGMYLEYTDELDITKRRTLTLNKPIVGQDWKTVSFTTLLPEVENVHSVKLVVVLMDTTTSNISSGASTYINYVKLEEGKVATYNGIMPSYFDELEKCKRYYQVINIDKLRVSRITDSTLRGVIAPISKMRCSGVCTVEHGIVTTFETTPTTVTDVSRSATHDNTGSCGQIQLQFTKVDHGLTDGVFSGVTVSVDCEL